MGHTLHFTFRGWGTWLVNSYSSEGIGGDKGDLQDTPVWSGLITSAEAINFSLDNKNPLRKRGKNRWRGYHWVWKKISSGGRESTFTELSGTLPLAKMTCQNVEAECSWFTRVFPHIPILIYGSSSMPLPYPCTAEGLIWGVIQIIRVKDSFLTSN